MEASWAKESALVKGSAATHYQTNPMVVKILLLCDGSFDRLTDKLVARFYEREAAPLLEALVLGMIAWNLTQGIYSAP